MGIIVSKLVTGEYIFTYARTTDSKSSAVVIELVAGYIVTFSIVVYVKCRAIRCV